MEHRQEKSNISKTEILNEQLQGIITLYVYVRSEVQEAQNHAKNTLMYWVG